MIRKIVLGSMISIYLFAGTVLAAQEQWNGLFARGGNVATLEQGGPFKTEQECLKWAKSKTLGRTDKYTCKIIVPEKAKEPAGAPSSAVSPVPSPEKASESKSRVFVS